MWYKMRYINKDGIVLTRTGADLLNLSGECDGTIIAIYSWNSASLYWKLVYSYQDEVMTA